MGIKLRIKMEVKVTNNDKERANRIDVLDPKIL